MATHLDAATTRLAGGLARRAVAGISRGAKRRASPPAKRGLATLELVLAVPILLFVMALMINFGTVACWKVRALNMARNAVWNANRPPPGSSQSPPPPDFPRPDFWPANATAAANIAGNAPSLYDSRVDQPVARGPLPLPGAVVNSDLLDPTRGFQNGSASLTLGYAILAKMGKYHLNADSVPLGDQWQFRQMGLGDNDSLRVPILYSIEIVSGAYIPDYIKAVKAIYYATFRPALNPLDNDDEFKYYKALFFGDPKIPGLLPDFHPVFPAIAAPDIQSAREWAPDHVTQLIERIEGKKDTDENVDSVAKRMTTAFIRLYTEAIKDYQGLMKANPADAVDIQAQIDQLQQKIDTLQQFLGTL